MKNVFKFKIFLIILGVAVFSLMFTNGYFFVNKDILLSKPKKVQVYPICRVLHNPEQFSNRIGVSGTIVESNLSKDFLLMTCGEKCEGMAVRFKIKKPAPGKQIEAYGQIKKEKGKYIFYIDKYKVI